MTVLAYLCGLAFLVFAFGYATSDQSLGKRLSGALALVLGYCLVYIFGAAEFAVVVLGSCLFYHISIVRRDEHDKRARETGTSSPES